MPFEAGHPKKGGRRRGTPNKATQEAREVARRLLDDAEYQRSLRRRLIRGEAPRVELHLWELAYGRPHAEPEGAAPIDSLTQLLENTWKGNPPDTAEEE